MDDRTLAELRSGAQVLGISLDSRLEQGLAAYLDLLQFWNRRINLTSVRGPQAVVTKHFLDSLAVVPYLPPAAATLLDVGSGGGFPGAVLAIARPTLRVTLVEPVQKKAAFLRTLSRALSCANMHVVAERIEDVISKPGFAPVDIAISRATWALPEWLPLGRTLVKPGGLVIGMEGALRYARPEGCRRVEVPTEGASRALVLCTV